MKLILHNVTVSPQIAYTPVKGRVVELLQDTTIRLCTNEGIYVFRLLRGFKWNGRSGGALVDCIAPNQGTPMESAMWAFHDASGYPNTISTELSGELLRQFAMKINAYGNFRASLIKNVVNAVANSWKAYDWEEVDAAWIDNYGKIRFELVAK